MSQIYRRLDNQLKESRKSFEAINQGMDRMDDQLSFLCYSNQMVNETMYFSYQNTARQFREIEAQGIPVTIANLAIHRHREEEMNQERMRHDQTVQEATAERAREANKGKAREVVPNSEKEEDSEELASSASEEWKEAWIVLFGPLFLVETIPTSPWYYLYDSVHLPRSERITRQEGISNASKPPSSHIDVRADVGCVTRLVLHLQGKLF
ncbi:hypothetical protein PIB30_040811 [Stylosanthes scabra]|uniref:Uncharacterized protein n=1 Tax=Stylosanthes scabra TaxID=79078 RepID=A0ABU6TFQ9_9FABA|nr:hypothetical protein [Stylosanthes scabra]